MGLEPTTSWTTTKCYHQLSYIHHINFTTIYPLPLFLARVKSVRVSSLEVGLAVHALLGLGLDEFGAVWAFFFEVSLEDFTDNHTALLE